MPLWYRTVVAVSSDCATRKLCPSAGLAFPQKGRSLSPNDMLYAQMTQQIQTAAKAYSAMNAELMAHFFLTMLPYRMTSPGMLCRPTRVADIICHALSPLLSQSGDDEELRYAIGITPAMVLTERLVGVGRQRRRKKGGELH